MKNQFWLTTSAVIEKIGVQFERAWQNDFQSKAVWMELLKQSHTIDEKDPEGIVAEQLVIDKHNTT